jgi:hypothetical protein
MNLDLRRFSYALEPLLKRRQWQLDTLNASLGRLQQAIDTAENDLQALRAQHLRESEDLARALNLQLDPAFHARGLQWLRQLKTRTETGSLALSALHAQRTALAAKCLAQQRKVDAVLAHRKDALEVFVREENGRLAAEADRDWLARPVRNTEVSL